jgi:hypothetical protein
MGRGIYLFDGAPDDETGGPYPMSAMPPPTAVDGPLGAEQGAP